MQGYHGVHDEDLPSVLARGLLIARTHWAREGRFWHLSFAQTPGTAAEYGVDLEVELGGLDLFEEGFVGAELRMYEDIPPHRLTVLEPQPRPRRRQACHSQT